MTSPDHLNRQPFIDLIKSIVETQSKNPLDYSIAIDGKWGCGKTFVLEMLEEQLSKTTLIFHYNAWENDFYEEPLVAILSVIIEKLNKLTKQKTPYNSIVDNLMNIALNALLSFVSVAVKHFTELDLKDFVKENKKQIRKIKKDMEIPDEINNMLPLQKAINTVRQNLKYLSNQIPVVIVIDELDRCLPEYAIKVLERLHHICDKNPVIQIIAIDKTQLSGSIAKVFGREVLPQNSDSVSQFADFYLQKFIDTTVPLNVGALENKLEILNGLEVNYAPYIRNDMSNRELIKLDEDFLLDFIKSIMTGISRRIQEKIFKQVELCHKLTIDSGIQLENCTYAILIYEIMSCIRLYIFHSRHQYRFSCMDNNTYYLQLGYASDNFSYNNDYNLIRNAANFFKITVQVEGNKQGPSIDCQNFIITDTKTYLLRFFVETHTEFLDPLQKSFINWISEDKKFLSKYDEIMETLTE